MADLIKKIKIKKEDGTFTDYIPIGADAVNVITSDGDSVQNKLNKKPYYYVNVAAMKADTRLKVGDMCQTLGYYEVNDAGSGQYQIINDNTVINDNGSIHELTNGLKAKLIANEEVNVKQYGAYGDGEHDDTNAIQAAINKYNNIYFTDGNYYITTPIMLKSNIKINGDNQATILIKSNSTSHLNNSIFMAQGTFENVNIYKYIITGEETSNDLVLVSNEQLYNITIPEQYLIQNNILIINLFYKKAILTTYNLDENIQCEIDINTISEIGEKYNITNNCSQGEHKIPTSFVENICIQNIKCNNLNSTANHQNAYLFLGYALKNIVIQNCCTKYIGLCNISMNFNNFDISTTTEDAIVNYGVNTSLLNDKVQIIHNKVEGLVVQDVFNMNTEASGIYLAYTKNANIENNDINYFSSGIAIWGGNVGPAYKRMKNNIKFVNNLILTNNRIENIKTGGIWCSRGSNISINSNYLNYGGDVGIDYEGCHNCVADGNTSNNFVNGSLASFYGSSEIIFSNNVCLADHDSINTLVYYNNGSEVDFCNILYFGNTFSSLNKIRNFIMRGGEINSLLKINNNIFNNVRILSDQVNNAMLEIINNKFYVNILNLNYNSFIELRPTNLSNIIDFIIKNNIFDCMHANNEQDNINDFDNFYPIRLFGTKWRGTSTVSIEENKFWHFNNDILLDYVNTGTNLGELFVILKDNHFSGNIVNNADQYCILFYDNNKLYNIEDRSIIPTILNFPNTIPVTGSYKTGTKIYYDVPDNDGYIGAICVTAGSPGVWKRFGKIETN